MNLRQRPEWRAGASLAWRIRATLALHADWLYVGERFDSAIPTGARELSSYTRADVALQWTPTDRLELSFAVDNLADSAKRLLRRLTGRLEPRAEAA